MTMKLKNFMLLLALTGMAASCSNDDLTNDGPEGGNTIDGRSEIQIAFSGTGESEEYERSARAIASDSENQIDKLSVYLFASNAANGTYYFLEKWEEGTAFDATINPTSFKKQASGAGWKASLYPHELKGLPYIKLFCVANNKPGGETTDEKFYAEDGTTEALAVMVPVTVDGDGTVSNDAAATKEDAFKAVFSKALEATEANGIIGTPLLMTGTGQTKISGSVSKVTIDLRRIMARFDIDNTTSRSSLTIEKVTMAHGRATGAFFGATPAAVVKADLDTKLFKYQPIDFTKHTGANTGLAESALYVYPNLATDESYLIVEGKYKSPITSEQVPVTYNIPIVRTLEGAAEGQYVAIKANSRYKLRITDVTQSNIFGTFEVVDWTSGGGINVKPDNDAPVMDAATAFPEEDAVGTKLNVPTALTDADGNVYGYEVTGDADGKGKFEITIAATGKVRAEKGAVDTTPRAAADTDWLTVGSPAYKEVDGVWYTTFAISYTESIGKQPVAVTFINDAASYDPALWTVVNFYGPKAVPAFSVVADGFSTGNITKVDDTTKAPAASVYAVNNSYVMFDVMSIEGVTVGTPATGYKVEEVKEVADLPDFTHRYKISVTDAANVAASATVEFKNKGDETKVTTLTLAKLDPALAFEATTTNAAVSWDEGTDTLKVDADAFTGSYVFKVKAPEGVSVSALTSEWITVTETTAWNTTDKFAVYTISAVANPLPAKCDDLVLTFTNALTNEAQQIVAPGLTVTVHKDFSKPKFAAGAASTEGWSTFNKDLTSDFTDPYASSITMYKVDGSAAIVKMTCSEAAAFEATAGIAVTQVGDTDEYKIVLGTASDIAAATTVLTAKNSESGAGTDRKATLTITWKSAEITAELTDDGGSVVIESKSGDDIIYTMDSSALPGKGFKFTVTALGGATTSLDVFGGDTDFLMKHTSNVGKATLAAGVAEVYTLKNSDEGQKTDITMTFKNAIEGGKDLKIIFKNTYVAP